MGNESSTPSEPEEEFHKNYHTRPLHHRFPRKDLIDSDDDEVNEHDHPNVSFRKRGTFGSLKGSVIAAAASKGSVSCSYVDPVLSAAAAGAAARKAKNAHSNPFRQHSKESGNNEWKKSLQRLAKTAASTASNVAHVTAPVLADAGSIVVESAKEFASDVQEEFSKPKYANADDEAESTIMFPYSPRQSWSGKSWYSPFTVHDTDLSPTTPNTGQSDSMGRVRIDLKVKSHLPLAPALKKNSINGRNEKHIPTKEQDREPKNENRRSVQIVHFPELAQLRRTEVSERNENCAMSKTIPKTENTAVLDGCKLPSSIDHQNGGMAISNPPVGADGLTDVCTTNETPDIENDIITTSPKSDVLVGTELKDLEEVEFTLLKSTEDSHSTDGTSNAEVTTKAEESTELELNSKDPSPGHDWLRHTEECLVSDTKSKEAELASLSGGADDELQNIKDPLVEESDEKKSMDEMSATNGILENQALNESDSSEFPSTDDIEELDIFGEFQQLVESAAKEGVFFSLDNEESLAALDFDVGNAEIERELEEASSPIRKELEDALEPHARVLEEASKPIEEQLANRTESPIFTETKTNGEDEEAVFEISVDDHDCDDNLPHIIHELSTDSEVETGEMKSPSKMENPDIFSLESTYGVEQELRDLLERLENGEVVDEDRLYELELFERYHSGETLTSDEMKDLDFLLKSRQSRKTDGLITNDEKIEHVETSIMLPSSNANASDASDNHERTNQDDWCDHNNSSTEAQLQPTYDEMNDACGSTRTNETEKLTTATQSEMENPWLYWSVGQKGSESSQLSSERLASILSTSDPEAIPNRGEDDRRGSYDNGDVSHADEGWRYWAHVENVVNDHQIEIQEASIVPREPKAIFGEKSEKIENPLSQVESPEWIYWSTMVWPQVGQPEPTKYTSTGKNEAESRNDLTLPGMITTTANMPKIISNPESVWLYWAQLGMAEQDTQEVSDLSKTQTEKYHVGEIAIERKKSNEDSVVAKKSGAGDTRHEGQEETELGKKFLSTDRELPNNAGQSNIDSLSTVQKRIDESRPGGSLSVLAGTASWEGESGWIFWSMLDDRTSQNIVEENNQILELQNATALQEVQLETDRVGIPTEQTSKPGWLHWAQLDDGKASASKPSSRKSVQLSALQQVKSPPSVLPLRETHNFGWMYWSAVREDSGEEGVEDIRDLKLAECSDEVQLETNRVNVKSGDNDEPVWLRWAELGTSKTRYPEQPEHGERNGQSLPSQPSDLSLLAVSSHGWLFWSTLGEAQIKKDGKRKSLDSGLPQASHVPEVQLCQPKTDAIAEQPRKPGWLHWAQFDGSRIASDSTQRQRDHSISMSQEKAIGKKPDDMYLRSGWLYWSTMGEAHIPKEDSNAEIFDFQRSTASEEVHLRADMNGELVGGTERPDWHYWAQIDEENLIASKLLGRRTTPKTEDQLQELFWDQHEDHTSSQTRHFTEKESNFSPLVKSGEVFTTKVTTRGMKTRSQATKKTDIEEPMIVGNSWVARELHTSYNPVILKIKDSQIEESSSIGHGNERLKIDTVSNLTSSESISFKALNAHPQKNVDSTDTRKMRQPKDDGQSGDPQIPMAKMESAVNNGDGDRSTPIKQNANVENESDSGINVPSTLKEVVGIFTKLSAENRQAAKNWNGMRINQEDDKDSRSGLKDVEGREETDILQEAQWIARKASDLADEVLRNRRFGIFSQTNEALEQRESNTQREGKTSETRTDDEQGTRFKNVPSSTDFAVDLLKNSREALDVVVSKLTVELTIKENQKSFALPDSIFKYEKSDTSSTSLSTVVSVPIEDYESDFDDESSEIDIAKFWDLMPTERGVKSGHNLLQPTSLVSPRAQQPKTGTKTKAMDNTSKDGSIDSEVLSPMLSPKARHARRGSRTLVKLHSNEFDDSMKRLEVELDSADSTGVIAGAGTKTKAIDSTSNPGSIDSEVLPPMLSPKARRARRGSRNLVKLHSNEFDDSMNRLEVELDSADSSVVAGSSSPKSESLGLALVSFSSIDSIDFLKKIPQEEITGRSSLFWRVLIANWKYSQIWKSMVGGSLSLNDDWRERESIFEEDKDSILSSSTIRFQVRNKRVHFSTSRNTQLISHFLQSQESFTPVMLEYLCDIGPNQLIAQGDNAKSVLRHALGQKDGSSFDVNSLLKLAESHQQSVAELIGDIVSFASLESISSEIKHSLGLKHYTAIRVKADRKYCGDILQVKDILRGQITFPNEASLICGLLCLHRKCEYAEGKETAQFEIVRLKNYFHKRDECLFSSTEMLTGYRHILINIRIAGTFVAELQFQLAQLFDILGPDGYQLHAEISSSLGVDSPINDGSKQESSHRGYMVLTACNIAKKILLVDHVKSSKNAKEEEQQTKSQVAQKKGDAKTSVAETGNEHNKGNSTYAVEEKEVKSIGGIGTAAAAAARAASPENSEVSENGGDISAIAAAAAKGRNQREKKPVEGIGAAAAAAARRSKMKDFKASSRGGSISGIADAVAEERNGGDTVSVKDKVSKEPVEGIAAAAAAAAAARRSKMKDFKASSRGGSISGIADAIAEERNGEDLVTKKKGEAKEPVGGIAAAAAAAAAARRSKMKDFKASSRGGSISGIADAIAKERNGEDLVTKKKGEAKEPVEGIAAAAAAAARRSNMKNIKAGAKGGGIAAIAAAVAKERNGEDLVSKKKREAKEPVGGIAAAAAAAALKSKMKHVNVGAKGGNLSPKIERDRQDPSGGIGAAATATDVARNDSMPNAGGRNIAALAAAVAKDRGLKGHSIQNRESRELTETKMPKKLSTSLKDGNSSPTLQNDPLKTKTLDSQTREMYLIKEAINVGIEEASSNPRDLSAFYCLYLLLRRLDEVDQDFSKQGDGSSTHRPTLKKVKTMLLTRCLAISNQASSLGMFGWLEYGSSNVVERSLGLPIEIMQRLAFNFASSGDWNKASDILSSCVMRCKEYLPLHHPTALCTMIDLASALMQTSRYREANALIKIVSHTVGEFLCECEAILFEDMEKRFLFERDHEQVFMLERKTDALSVLHTFVTDFSSLLSRDFISLVDPINQITLLNHSLVANCFAVLASCNAVCERGSATKDEDNKICLRFWSLAYLHHQHSLRGWTKIHSLSHPFAASAALSVARCLRELGKIDESITFLESLVECLQHSSAHDDFGESDLDIEPRVLGAFSFLPPKSGHGNEPVGISLSDCQRGQMVVICLWTLAVFVVQRKPDEQGRVHALKLLHQASDTLRNLLYYADDMHGSTRKVCLELYTCVEEEARVLFEPLRMVQMQSSDIKEKLRMSYQSSLTSMRRKRWFQQQQSTESQSQITHPVQQFI